MQFFYLLQGYYNLLKKAGITWKKTQKINPAKNEELVQAKKSQGETIGKMAIHEQKLESLQCLWLTNVIYYGVISIAILGA